MKMKAYNELVVQCTDSSPVIVLTKSPARKKTVEFNSFIMAYCFANLSYFRQGFEYLGELESEMRQSTKVRQLPPTNQANTLTPIR